MNQRICQAHGRAASVFRSATDRAGLKLVINCPDLGEPVYVDREMWEKIVFNLLSNAFKFTFQGEIEVSLRRAEGVAELSVRDTGTGIPEHELAHLFEHFHRVKGASGRTFEGSGIGLSLVRSPNAAASRSAPQHFAGFRQASERYGTGDFPYRAGVLDQHSPPFRKQNGLHPNRATIRPGHRGHPGPGQGMSPDKLAEIQLKGSGLGIRGLRERLREFEGSLNIESDDSGTRILVQVPIPADASRAESSGSSRCGPPFRFSASGGQVCENPHC
jgi:Histidine kinase-, DNA gyrase B-, and HSP90-like ATPase